MQVLCEPVLISRLTALASIWGSAYEATRSLLPCCHEAVTPVTLNPEP